MLEVNVFKFSSFSFNLYTVKLPVEFVTRWYNLHNDTILDLRLYTKWQKYHTEVTMSYLTVLCSQYGGVNLPCLSRKRGVNGLGLGLSSNILQISCRDSPPAEDILVRNCSLVCDIFPGKDCSLVESRVAPDRCVSMVSLLGSMKSSISAKSVKYTRKKTFQNNTCHLLHVTVFQCLVVYRGTWIAVCYHHFSTPVD